ncbi:MAG: sigma-54 interaction domain-containing protein [Anaerovoracaceae bacterium]|jgi:PAS domain S-box-containing protein
MLLNEDLLVFLDNLDEMVLLEDDVGNIRFANQAYCDCFGFPRDKIIGRSVFDFIIPEDWEVTNVESKVSPENPSYRIEGRSKRADGKIIWIQYIGKAFFDDKGNRIGFQEIAVDITEWKEKISEKTRELTKANQVISDYYSKLTKFGKTVEDNSNINFAAFHKFEDIRTNNPKMKRLIAYAKEISKYDVSVLIEGESGTGKELFAQAIHNESKRANGPFVPINCGAIPAELIESEFFGYAEGAFTGASKGGKAGKFEQASGGTLFLDEIGEMPLSQQVVLLRVLETKRVTRIGGNKAIPVDVRVICATNKDLYKEVVEKRFRSDLYFRLNVINLNIPPLRERKEDIKLIFNEMLNRYQTVNMEIEEDINDEIMAKLYEHEWPGNVRELNNMFERIIYAPKGQRMEFLNMINSSNYNALSDSPDNERNIKVNERNNEQLDELSKITNLLAMYENNISMVARKMGISRNTLYKKLKKYNLLNKK